MSNYAIINMKKMNSVKLKRLGKHNHREGQLSNNKIDKSKKDENYHIAGYETDNLERKVLDIIDKKIKSQVETVKKRKRKDENGNVIRIDEQKIIRDVVKYKADTSLVNEFLISASPEYINSLSLEEQKRYFTEATNFLNERYGNVVYAIVHMDETTPHLHVGVIPLVEDKQTDFKLSSSQIFGDRKELKALQEDFPKHLKSAGFQVKRGQEGGQRKSLDNIEYRLNQTKNELEVAELQFKAQKEMSNGFKLPVPEAKSSLLDKNKLIIDKNEYDMFISTINGNVQYVLNTHLEAELKKKQAELEKKLHEKDLYLKKTLAKSKANIQRELGIDEKRIETLTNENKALKNENKALTDEIKSFQDIKPKLERLEKIEPILKALTEENKQLSNENKKINYILNQITTHFPKINEFIHSLFNQNRGQNL